MAPHWTKQIEAWKKLQLDAAAQTLVGLGGAPMYGSGHPGCGNPRCGYCCGGYGYGGYGGYGHCGPAVGDYLAGLARLQLGFYQSLLSLGSCYGAYWNPCPPMPCPPMPCPPMPCPPPPCCSPPPCRPKKKKCHDPCGDDDDEEEGDDEDHDGGVHIPPDPQGGSGVGGATRACGYLHSPALKINLSDQDGRREFDVELLLRCVAEYQVTLTAFTTTPDAAHPEPRELEVLLDPNSRRFRPMTVNRRVSVRISLGQGSQPGKYRGQVLATERNGRFVVRRNVLVNVTSVVYSIPKTPPGTPVSKSAGP